MQIEEALREIPHLPPSCPSCCELMSFKSKEERMLLRGFQLSNYTFECNICGYSNARLFQDEY
jgi:hypothetical protein